MVGWEKVKISLVSGAEGCFVPSNRIWTNLSLPHVLSRCESTEEVRKSLSHCFNIIIQDLMTPRRLPRRGKCQETAYFRYKKAIKTRNTIDF